MCASPGCASRQRKRSLEPGAAGPQTTPIPLPLPASSPRCRGPDSQAQQPLPAHPQPGSHRRTQACVHTGTRVYARSTHQGQASYRHKRTPRPQEACAAIAPPHSEAVGKRGSREARPAARGPHRCSARLVSGSGRGVRGPTMGLRSQAQVQPTAGLDVFPTPSPPSLPPQHAHTHACILLTQKTDSGEGTRNDGI